jgi:DNA-binding CsgD family transcriptional regulator/class 3 adenylate cyclase
VVDVGVTPSETRYARSGAVHIAYQVVGNGPLDLVFVMGWVSSIDWYWAEPRVARFLRRLASFSRLILFDKRGTGLSDRVAELPTLEQRMDDARAVMDAAGSGRAALAVRLGDQAWGELIAAHDALVREQLARFRGREVKKTIGGFLATFDGPARAIRCGLSIVEAGRGLGLSVRAGLHAGEYEIQGGELGGVALQIAERVFDRAASGEVVVSSTVKDLVAGARIEFEELETRLLTGPASGWRLHRVVSDRQSPQSAPGAIVVADPARPPAALSHREREVVTLVARGLSNRQLADELAISPATVERHVANILGKLGFHSRAQIAAWAVMHDLLRGESR